MENKTTKINKPIAQANYREIVNWWEKKRWIYTLFLVFLEILVLLKFRQETLVYGKEAALIHSIAFTLVASNRSGLKVFAFSNKSSRWWAL